MKEMISYKDLSKSDGVIRNRLVELMYKNPITFVGIAKAIGVAPQTLQYFLEEKKKSDNYTLFKIFKYVMDREKELEDDKPSLRCT